MKIIKDYVQNTESLTFYNSVKFTTGDNNDTSGNNSNNKDNNKIKTAYFSSFLILGSFKGELFLFTNCELSYHHLAHLLFLTSFQLLVHAKVIFFNLQCLIEIRLGKFY